jgi:hypothetical protein
MRLLQISLVGLLFTGGLIVEAESAAGAATISASHHARAAKRKHRKHRKHRRKRTPPPAQEM